MPKQNDEYNWSDYTKEYSAQLQEIKEKDGVDFFITKHEVDNDGNIVFFDNLHPNWMEIYNTAFKLKPKSILECGCGGGYQLKNLHTVLPEAKIYGFDLLQSQLDFGRVFSKLPEEIKTWPVNLTEDISTILINAENDIAALQRLMTYGAEFVFSHAVAMHLSTENAKAFLKNMSQLTSKYIFMVEGVANHENWFDLVKETLPQFEMSFPNKYINNAILLTRK